MQKLLLGLVLIAAFAVNAQERYVPGGVTVSGEGIVEVVPDQVVVTIGIEHEGDYIEKIKEKTETAVDAVLDFLKKEGVPEENIQTQYVRLDQQYEYQTKTYTYSSRQAISIKLEKIDRYGEIMDGLMKAGANRINSVQFKSSEADKYEAQARALAAQKAKQKAMDYAEALGQQIGKAIAITDVSTGIRPVYANFSTMEAMPKGGKQTIAPGEMEITAEVQVTFRLN